MSASQPPDQPRPPSRRLLLLLEVRHHRHRHGRLVHARLQVVARPRRHFDWQASRQAGTCCTSQQSAAHKARQGWQRISPLFLLSFFLFLFLTHTKHGRGRIFSSQITFVTLPTINSFKRPFEWRAITMHSALMSWVQQGDCKEKRGSSAVAGCRHACMTPNLQACMAPNLQTCRAPRATLQHCLAQEAARTAVAQRRPTCAFLRITLHTLSASRTA